MLFYVDWLRVLRKKYSWVTKIFVKKQIGEKNIFTMFWLEKYFTMFWLERLNKLRANNAFLGQLVSFF